MRCPNCAASLDDDSWICAGCGTPVRPRDFVVQMDLAARPLQVLFWLIVATLVGVQISFPVMVHARLISIDWPGPWNQSGLVSFPMLLVWLAAGALALAGAWIFEAGCRSFCRWLLFSDESSADFSGRADQILLWWVVLVLVGRRWDMLPGVVQVALWLVAAVANLQVIRWFVRHVELSNGRRFSFLGGYLELVGWELLLGLSVLTIIGWAWVLAAMYQWMARNTTGNGRALRFHGEGVEILWRTVVAIVGTIPIVTIPWVWAWYARWLVRSTTIERQLAEAV